MYPGTKKLKFLETYRELIENFFPDIQNFVVHPTSPAHFPQKTRPLARDISDFWLASRGPKKKPKMAKNLGFLGLPKNRSQLTGGEIIQKYFVRPPSNFDFAHFRQKN